MIYNILTKRKFADSTYKDKQVLEFNINLAKNQYMNFNSVHVCFPIKIKSNADNINDVPVRTIAVNNFFAHWLKEVDIKRYDDDSKILSIGYST